MTNHSRTVARWASLVLIAAIISACAQSAEDVLGPMTETPIPPTAAPPTSTPIPEPVDVPELTEYNGTPSEICEAATPAEDPQSRSFAMAEDVLEADTDYRAIFCTAAGPVYVDLYEDLTPVTVNNFMFLSRIGYYNNTIFHRVMEDFMAQGGDHTGTGRGGPGYQFQDEFVGYLTFDEPGLLAMANSGPNTNGSQFFLTTSEPVHLNYRHTIFGEVLEGQDVVEAINLHDAETQVPDEATALNTIVILADPAAVDSTYEQPDADFAAADFIDGLSALSDPDLLPPNLLAGLSEAEEISTDDVIANAPESVREEYGTLLTDNNHAFRVTVGITDAECVGNFFEELTYTVDAFGSEEEATAVRNSEVLAAVYEAEDFTAAETEALPFFSQMTPSCVAVSDEADMEATEEMADMEATDEADMEATEEMADMEATDEADAEADMEATEEMADMEADAEATEEMAEMEATEEMADMEATDEADAEADMEATEEMADMEATAEATEEMAEMEATEEMADMEATDEADMEATEEMADMEATDEADMEATEEADMEATEEMDDMEATEEADAMDTAAQTLSGRIVLQRGPYLVTVTGALPRDLASDPQFMELLGELLSQNGTRLIEPYLGEIYRAVIR